jgi:hypothetical protein
VGGGKDLLALTDLLNAQIFRNLSWSAPTSVGLRQAAECSELCYAAIVCRALSAARKQLWADMEAQGLVIKQEPYQVPGLPAWLHVPCWLPALLPDAPQWRLQLEHA